MQEVKSFIYIYFLVLLFLIQTNKGESQPPLSGSIASIKYAYYSSFGKYLYDIDLRELYKLKSPLDNKSYFFCNSSNYINLGWYEWTHCTQVQCKPVSPYLYRLACKNFDDVLDLALYSPSDNVLSDYSNSFTFSTGDTFILQINSDYINLVTFYKRLNVNNKLNQIPSVGIYGFDFTRSILQGCDTVYKIPVVDYDNDVVRCRHSIANGTYGAECKTCDPTSYYLDEKACTITFPSTLDRSVLAEIQVEDFVNEIDKNPMSSTSLKIYGKLIPNTNKMLCGEKPNFTSKVPQQDSCISIDANEKFVGVIEADVPALPSSIENYKIIVDKSFAEFDFGETILNKNLL
jgi:hypothetical protein